ncbi:MAG: hypothetical protein JNL68_01080 [Burkholderiales bacterium]|nr:hypothetical protein [Burkholderiales bacterium]
MSARDHYIIDWPASLPPAPFRGGDGLHGVEEQQPFGRDKPSGFAATAIEPS